MYKNEDFSNYFLVQTNFEKHMREKLMLWMIEICSEMRF